MFPFTLLSKLFFRLFNSKNKQRKSKDNMKKESEKDSSTTKTGTVSHSFENIQNDQDLSFVETLNRLYRLFQDEYVKNCDKGRITMVSRTHLTCEKSPNGHIVTVPELKLDDSSFEMKELIPFLTLLPYNANFYILHYTDSYDVMVIEWNSTFQSKTVTSHV